MKVREAAMCVVHPEKIPTSMPDFEAAKLAVVQAFMDGLLSVHDMADWSDGEPDDAKTDALGDIRDYLLAVRNRP